jgi:hypothetical protein
VKVEPPPTRAYGGKSDEGMKKEIPSNKPLCIYCDGTLLRSDLLQESLVRVLIRKRLMIFSCLLWLTRGRAYIKRRLAQTTMTVHDV